MPCELADDTVLSLTQNARRIMVAVIDVVVSEVATRRERLFYIGEKFTFLTQVRSGGLGDEEAKTAMDLVQSYSELLSGELILGLDDLTSLANLSGESVKKLLIVVIRYGPNAFANIITATKSMLTTASIASCERSFSKVKLLKIDLRTSMTHTRFSDLAVPSIENQRTDKLNGENVLEFFFQKREEVPRRNNFGVLYFVKKNKVKKKFLQYSRNVVSFASFLESIQRILTYSF